MQTKSCTSILLALALVACATDDDEAIVLTNDGKADGATERVITVARDQTRPVTMSVHCDNYLFRCGVDVSVRIADPKLQQRLSDHAARLYDEWAVELEPGDAFGVTTFQLSAYGVYWEASEPVYSGKFENLIGVVKNDNGTLGRMTGDSFEIRDLPRSAQINLDLRPLLRPADLELPERIQYRVSASWH
jgi:hypothetical protein